VYGQGLAEQTKKRLNERGIAEILFEGIQLGQVDLRISFRGCARWTYRFCTMPVSGTRQG
jgi:hypothetical protein